MAFASHGQAQLSTRDPRWRTVGAGVLASRPATCTANRDVYICIGTGCSIGAAIHYCTAANTWSEQGGSASGFTGVLPVANGGTGTADDVLVRKDGSGNVTIGITLPTGVPSGSFGAVVDCSTNQSFNVLCYGAKGDERFFSDASMTASSATLTSASGAFTSADTGKTVTVNAGALGIYTSTYTSGATVTGIVGQYCAVGSFNGSGTDAAGYLYLTGTDTIAASTPLDLANIGTGFATAPTSATLSKATIGTGTVTTSGTAVTWVSGTLFGAGSIWTGSPITINGVDYTVSAIVSPTSLTLTGSAGTQSSPVAFTTYSAACSGTITISSTLVAAPITTTATYVNVTTLTLGTTAVSTVTNARAAIGTDDSTAFQSAITAAAVKGGTVYAPAGRYLILSQLLMPSSASSPQPIQSPILIDGDGMDLRPWVQWSDIVSPSEYRGTVLDMRYSGAGGKIQSGAGAGRFVVSRMTLMDYGDDATSYIYGSDGGSSSSGPPASQIHVLDVAFTDNPRKAGPYRTPNKTAIELNNSISGSVERCVFDRVKIGVLLGEWSNGNEIRNNYWTWTTGSDHTGAPILLDGTAHPVTTNEIHGNNIEMAYHLYGLKALNGATNNYLHANEWEDVATAPTIASVWLDPGATRNIVLDAPFSGGIAPVDANLSAGASSNAITTACGTGVCVNQLTVSGNANLNGTTQTQGLDSYGRVTAWVPTSNVAFGVKDTGNSNRDTVQIANSTNDGAINLFNLNAVQTAQMHSNGVSYFIGGTMAVKPPTSCSGQPAGALWNNGGTPAICP